METNDRISGWPSLSDSNAGLSETQVSEDANTVKVALFVPCYIDQFYPNVAIAALRVLERVGITVVVPEWAVCCGQPTANARLRTSRGASARPQAATTRSRKSIE